MDHLLLPAWRGRRVLLAGGEDDMTCAMHALLARIGARPACIPLCSGNETYFRALSTGRGVCLIAPNLIGPDVCRQSLRLAALQTILCESREAGTPLVMLLANRKSDDASQAYAISQLAAYAQRAANAPKGDMPGLQWIWHSGGEHRQTCIKALELGARYLMGDHTRLGFFSLE